MNDTTARDSALLPNRPQSGTLPPSKLRLGLSMPSEMLWLLDIARHAEQPDKLNAQKLLCHLAQAEARQLHLVRAVQCAIDRSIPSPATRAEAARRRL